MSARYSWTFLLHNRRTLPSEQSTAACVCWSSDAVAKTTMTLQSNMSILSTKHVVVSISVAR